MAGPGAAQAKGKPRAGGATGSLRRAFVVAALATSVPVPPPHRLSDLGADQPRAQPGRARGLRPGEPPERPGGEALRGADRSPHRGRESPRGGRGESRRPARLQGRRLKQTFPDVDRAVLIDELGVAAASVPRPGRGQAPRGRRPGVVQAGGDVDGPVRGRPLAGRPGDPGGDLRAGADHRGSAPGRPRARSPAQARPGSPGPGEAVAGDRGRARDGPRGRRRAPARAVPDGERLRARRVRRPPVARRHGRGRLRGRGVAHGRRGPDPSPGLDPRRRGSVGRGHAREPEPAPPRRRRGPGADGAGDPGREFGWPAARPKGSAGCVRRWGGSSPGTCRPRCRSPSAARRAP